MQTSAVAAVEQAIRDDFAFVDAGFRVMSVSPPETPDGALLPLRVGTLYGEHLAYAVVDQSVGGPITVGMVLRATGWPEAFEAGPGLLLEVEGLVPPEEYTLEMCPVRGLPVVGAQSLLRISELLDSEIKNPLVNQAVHALLASPKIFVPFFTVPAAQKAHHACPGGLALHSLEAAQIVAAMPRECFGESISRDLAIVGALLHDLGKIQQYQPGGGYRHGSISHETRTIALAQGMLDWLTVHEDQSVAEQLMYLLSADGKREHADCPEVAAIVMADRLSATADATASAFRCEKAHLLPRVEN